MNEKDLEALERQADWELRRAQTEPVVLPPRPPDPLEEEFEELRLAVITRAKKALHVPNRHKRRGS